MQSAMIIEYLLSAAFQSPVKQSVAHSWEGAGCSCTSGPPVRGHRWRNTEEKPCRWSVESDSVAPHVSVEVDVGLSLEHIPHLIRLFHKDTVFQLLWKAPK